jgi:hypothetical protein
MDHIVRKTSTQSDYRLNSAYNRSDSLTNTRPTNKKQLKYGRYSVREFTHKKSSFITNKERKSTNFSYQKPKSKTQDVHHRRNSERYSLNPTKYSLSNNTSTNSYYNRGQQLHYITCKRDNNQQILTGQSSSTTTTSNLTRSTMNTSSESSILIKSLSNHVEQLDRLYRK